MARAGIKKRTIRVPQVSGEIPRDDLKRVVGGIHVSPDSGTWRVLVPGSQRISERFETKSAAVSFAKATATESGRLVVVHGRNGQVRRIDC